MSGWRTSMLRKSFLALTAGAALAVTMLPGPASAQQDYRRDWRDYGWQRPWGWSSGERAGYFGQFPFAGDFAYPGCWRAYRVMTPAGWRIERQWTCY